MKLLRRICDMKIGTKVKVVNLIETGLEGFEDEFELEEGVIINIDGEDPYHPYTVQLFSYEEGVYFHFHAKNLELLGEDDVLE